MVVSACAPNPCALDSPRTDSGKNSTIWCAHKLPAPQWCRDAQQHHVHTPRSGTPIALNAAPSLFSESFEPIPMVWHARLHLDYTQPRAGATGMHFTHDGPLRVLRSLYPEGPGICHNVLVHPPGGLVGGDVLDVKVRVNEGAHALITTPGATRFYRSNGAPALQRTQIALAPGARMEWLPLETIAYPACDAANELHLDLAPDSQLLAWDITALGLPNADSPYDRGRFVQHIHWPGRFLEHGVIDAQDHRLMNSPLGLAGARCLGSLILASGTPLPRALREQLLESTQERLASAPEAVFAGVTSPNPHMLVLRGLAPVVEPLMQLWQAIWAAWRQQWWGIAATPPRIWAT